jgi:SPP1 family predicted phage head-tail adaptor
MNRTTTTNELGENVASATAGVTVFAKISPLTATEMVNADQIYMDATHEIRVRWPLSITSQDAFSFKGRIFNILGIRNILERNIELAIIVKEQAA